MSVGIEARVEAAWFAKQTAQGSPASTALKRGRKVGGDMVGNVEHANQNWSTGGRFTSAEDYVQSILGNGNPVLQGQPGVLAALFYLMLGQETVTGSADPWDHVATPANAGSFWTTWWKRVGEAVGPVRHKFNDCRLTSLRVEGSSAQRVLQVTPTWISLDPMEVFATDPVKVEDAERALLFTEGEGRFKLNDVVFRAHSSFAFTINDNVTPWYGDSARPQAVVYGAGTIDLEAITLLVDQQGKDRHDELIYGTASPPAGMKPRSDVPVLGSYEIDLQRGSRYVLTVTGTPTGGTFTITVDGQTTAPIVWNAAAAVVLAAIEALPNVVPGDVTVTGGPGPGTPWTIVFTLRSGVVLTAAHAFTGGTTPAITPSAVAPQRRFMVEFPYIKWSPDVAIAGNPDGGAVELALGAQTRNDPAAVDPHIRSTIRCGDPAFS